MKILISGGAGFIGKALTKALNQRGENVRVLTRDRNRVAKLFPPFTNVEAVEADITRPETLPPALAGVDLMIQCAQFPGHPVENRRKGHTYFQVDALGTENLAKAAKTAGVKKIIYFSGAETAEQKSEPWFRAKYYAEQAIHATGLPAIILRPSWIYGPEDKSLNKLLAIAQYLPVLGLIGDGKNRVQPLFIEDVSAIVTAFCQLDDENITLEIGGPEVMTTQEMLQRALNVIGRKRLLFPIPKLLCKIISWPLQFLPHPPMTPQAIDFLTMDIPIDLAPLKKRLPQLKLKTLEEGLRCHP